MTTPLAYNDLEIVYDLLAEAIHQAGEDRENLFLAKLSLTLCHKLGDIDEIKDALQIAIQDLDGPPPKP